MQILGIDHVVLRVRDESLMTHFYCDVLGCAVERRHDEIGLVQLRAGAQLIDLLRVGGAGDSSRDAAPTADSRNMDHVCLRVAGFDIEWVKAHLIAHGVQPGAVGMRYGSTGEGMSIYLKDPEGNTLELRG